ncbi:hypothetical protein Clacol_010228 [Clathrus columnatus]|uniref:Sulfotransferase family protein n=1 Tax=Clathrus columnatus TaxID=1419009 RepID=A0AAV5AS23_9AGAM|nr:hypothetical protein Clacol_010228 [Clathrus columnatus]
MGSKPKVICVGLGRTGVGSFSSITKVTGDLSRAKTLSLAVALNELGFGPCYHLLLRPSGADDLKPWYNFGQGLANAEEDLWNLLKDYNSFSDYPVAINFEKLYKAYPDAKFILTTRDPAKWESSIKAISPFLNNLRSNDWLNKWSTIDAMARYHRGRLLTDMQGEIIAHNQRVIEVIPADQLLVYEVSQGWEPLVNYLEV